MIFIFYKRYIRAANIFQRSVSQASSIDISTLDCQQELFRHGPLMDADASSDGLSRQEQRPPSVSVPRQQKGLSSTKKLMIPPHGGSWKQGPNTAVLQGLRSAACASRQLP